MFLNPGASREPHWHATAAEWAVVIDGRCQTVVIEPSDASEINNCERGDFWYFARAHCHAIQTIGDKPCYFILSFDNGAFSESTFPVSDWIHAATQDLFDASPNERSTHKFRLLRDQKAVRDFEGGTFCLVAVDEFPASKTMSGGLMVIEKGKQRNLHWHVNANEWQCYLRGKGQVALFESGGAARSPT